MRGTPLAGSLLGAMAALGLATAALGGPGEERPRFAIGAGASIWKPESAGGANVLLLGHVRAFVAGPFALQAEAGLWSNHETRLSAAGTTEETSARDIPVAVDLLFFSSPAGGLAGYAGGGVVWHSWRLSRVLFTSEQGAESFVTDSDVGAELVMGAEARAMEGFALYVEARYQFGVVEDVAGSGKNWVYRGPSGGAGFRLALR